MTVVVLIEGHTFSSSLENISSYTNRYEREPSTKKMIFSASGTLRLSNSTLCYDKAGKNIGQTLLLSSRVVVKPTKIA